MIHSSNEEKEAIRSGVISAPSLPGLIEGWKETIREGVIPNDPKNGIDLFGGLTGNYDAKAAISGNLRMMSIGLYQPYATLMTYGKLETRNRQTKVRGWTLLYSTKRKIPGWLVTAISGIQIRERVDALLAEDPTKDIYRHAIAIGYLNGSRPMTRDDEDKAFALYEKGKWIWDFQNIVPIEPFPYKGSQEWKVVTEEEKKLIKFKNIAKPWVDYEDVKARQDHKKEQEDSLKISGLI